MPSSEEPVASEEQPEEPEASEEQASEEQAVDFADIPGLGLGFCALLRSEASSCKFSTFPDRLVLEHYLSQ